jgi:glycosyltransferase involved in cell wall biosynthesis
MPKFICFAYLYLFKDLRGITRYTIDVCNALSLKGKDVSIVCPYRRRDFIEKFFNQRINIFCVPHYKYRRITTIPGFLWFFLTKKFDEVNISLGFGEAYAAVMAKRLKKDFKYNVLLHMAYEKDYDLFSKLYRRGMGIGLFDKANKIISVSNYVSRSVKDIVDEQKLFVSYNGVNLERFFFSDELRREKRKELNAGKEELLLLTTSALSAQKNIRNIFPAIKALIDEGLKIRYILAGYGSKNDIEYLKACINSFGLEQNITYLGEVKDTVSLYNAADIFVLLSQYEAFGISVIEAAACGLPCITSDESAFPEIVNDSMGFRVQKDDTVQMIKILKMLKDKEKRKSYRIAARERVEKYFNIKKNCSIFLNEN